MTRVVEGVVGKEPMAGRELNLDFAFDPAYSGRRIDEKKRSGPVRNERCPSIFRILKAATWAEKLRCCNLTPLSMLRVTSGLSNWAITTPLLVLRLGNCGRNP